MGSGELPLIGSPASAAEPDSGWARPAQTDRRRRDTSRPT